MNHNHYNHNPQKTGGGFYVCPMHPEVTGDKPGMCPECGMQLVPTKKRKSAIAHEGHDKHAGHSTAMFFRKFWVSLILTIPVVLYADVVEKIFRWSPPEFPGSEYLQLARTLAERFRWSTCRTPVFSPPQTISRRYSFPIRCRSFSWCLIGDAKEKTQFNI